MEQHSQQPALTSDSVIQSKLTAPPPRSAVVVRRRLLAQLEAGLRGPLTLIAAPAGFGKTTLLSVSCARLSDTATPLAWLTLEEDDNDPLRFWHYLIRALDQLQPGIAAPFSAYVQGFQSASPRAMLPALLNTLGALSAEMVLVLDDYHVIDSPAIHQALTFLLDHLPLRLHLVIASRTDPPLPLARLRTRNQLTEIRADDLRFDPDETAEHLLSLRL